jgi:hypothetical protein
VDTNRLTHTLNEEFGGSEAELRVVTRQVRDLVDSGQVVADRGRELTVDELVDQYCNQQRSLQTIAEHYETSIKAVQFQLEKADVDCELTNPKTANIGFSRSKTRSYRGNYSEMDVSTDRTRGVSSNTQRRRKHTQFDL